MSNSLRNDRCDYYNQLLVAGATFTKTSGEHLGFTPEKIQLRITGFTPGRTDNEKVRYRREDGKELVVWDKDNIFVNHTPESKKIPNPLMG